jgi:hypothetical protein
MQGHLFGKAVPVEELLTLLEADQAPWDEMLAELE